MFLMFFIYFVISVSDSSVSLLLLLPAHTEKAGSVLSSAQGVSKRRSRKYARLRCRRLRVDCVSVLSQSRPRAEQGKVVGTGQRRVGQAKKRQPVSHTVRDPRRPKR